MQDELVVYKTKEGKTSIEVRVDQDNIWMTQAQIASLFRTDRSVVTKHILNIFKSKELTEKSNVQKMHIPLSDKPANFYSLDMIISIGYRVNSAQATQFRIWATDVLKKHLIDGYTVNERKLKASEAKLRMLQKTIRLIDRVQSKKELGRDEAEGLLKVIGSYSRALDLLDDYDHQRMSPARSRSNEKFKLTYEKSIRIISQLKKKFVHSALFGREKDSSLKSSLNAIYQTFGKKDLYPGAELKAANLLYFLVKNHSFIDGNKRIAASLFVWFLNENGLLYRGDGSKRIADSALVALTLMIAESDPAEKDVMVALVTQLVNG